jgi:hypothetical protein
MTGVDASNVNGRLCHDQPHAEVIEEYRRSAGYVTRGERYSNTAAEEGKKGKKDTARGRLEMVIRERERERRPLRTEGWGMDWTR